MANPAADARQKAQAIWPGAFVHARGKKFIRHQHPTEPGRFMFDTQIGPMHYGESEDQEIDTVWQAGVSPQDDPWLWKMVKAGFNVYAGPGTMDFDAGQIVKYVHPESGEDVTFQAQQLQWTNDLDQIEVVADPQQIGHSSIVDDTIFWDGAFGAGLDFRWQAQTARLAKYLTIQNAGAIGAPPQFIIDGGNPVLRLQFIFQKSSGVEIWIDGVLWDEKANNPQVTLGNVEFRLESTGEPLWWFKQPSASDSNEDTDSPQLIQRFRKVAQNIFVAVRVPWSWLDTASFPVEIDPTIDEQVGASADDSVEIADTTNDITTLAKLMNAPNVYFAARWQADIVNGATIDVAYFEAYNTTNNRPFEYDIYVEDADTAVQFTNDNANISGRTAHVVVDWSIGLQGIGFIQSPSIASEVEDTIGRGSWVADNWVAIFFDETTGEGAGGVIASWDSDSAEAAKLHIEYSTGLAALEINHSPGNLAAYKTGVRILTP